MQYAEGWLAQKHRGDLSLPLGDYYQRQAERAQRRRLAAIKALAIGAPRPVCRAFAPIAKVF